MPGNAPSTCDVELGVKGDRVEVVIDAGGSTRCYEIVATRAGRRVEITHGRGIVEVTEVTRGGSAVRTARFMSARVLALVEHPAPRGRLPDDEQPDPSASHRRPEPSRTEPHPSDRPPPATDRQPAPRPRQPLDEPTQPAASR
jgi:hypothetical protein